MKTREELPVAPSPPCTKPSSAQLPSKFVINAAVPVLFCCSLHFLHYILVAVITCAFAHILVRVFGRGSSLYWRSRGVTAERDSFGRWRVTIVVLRIWKRRWWCVFHGQASISEKGSRLLFPGLWMISLLPDSRNKTIRNLRNSDQSWLACIMCMPAPFQPSAVNLSQISARRSRNSFLRDRTASCKGHLAQGWKHSHMHWTILAQYSFDSIVPRWVVAAMVLVLYEEQIQVAICVMLTISFA